MRVAEAREILKSWDKEAAHTEFQYLSDAQAAFITGAINDRANTMWRSGMPHLLRCPSCSSYGFKSKDVWSVGEGSRLKCFKCGEWADVADWEAKTLEVRG